MSSSSTITGFFSSTTQAKKEKVTSAVESSPTRKTNRKRTAAEREKEKLKPESEMSAVQIDDEADDNSSTSANTTTTTTSSAAVISSSASSSSSSSLSSTLTAEQKTAIEEKKAAAQAKLSAKKQKTNSETKSTTISSEIVITSFSSSSSSSSSSVSMTNLEQSIPSDWLVHLRPEVTKPYFVKLKATLTSLAASQQIFPPAPLIFNALSSTPFDSIKVVIIGQDPYHDNGQAEGLCFSVPLGITVPSSLKNIYKELASDLGSDKFVIPKHGHLKKWADQGVLLLNATLTVKAHDANSHEKIGWSSFTDAIITAINRDLSGVVFLLWGAFAHKKGKSVNESKHHVLKTVHPSGLSAAKGFFGCKHFSKANALLKKHGKTEIDWQV